MSYFFSAASAVAAGVEAAAASASQVPPLPSIPPISICDALSTVSSCVMASTTAAFPSSPPYGASALALPSAPVPAVACPPKARPTLASTAALFLPDQASPILLAPSESEIQSDPRYYTFGAQLVAALVLFFIAYFLAYVVLGSVRRRERNAKLAWRAERKRQAEAQGRIYTLRPTLHRVAPSVPLAPSPFSLDLSDPVLAMSALARAKRRVRYYFDWITHTPARWRRRWRLDKAKHASHAKVQVQQAAREARAKQHMTSPQLSSATPDPPAPVTFRRRLSNLVGISAFLRGRPLTPATTPSSGRRDQPEDESITLSLILGSFTSMLPTTLPWMVAHTEHTRIAAPKPKKHRTTTSISGTFSQWTAALSGSTTIGPTASPPGSPLPSPLDLGPSYFFDRPTASTSSSHSAASSSGSHLHSSPALIRSSSPPPQPLELVTSHSLSTLPHSDFPEVENEREFLTYTLAALVLAVALAWLELLVLSVLASTSLGGVALNEFYAFKWCTTEMVSILWVAMVWISSISLFVLAPFAFLYYEAEGLGGRRGFVSRVSETLLVLSAFTILLYGSFHILQSLLDRGGLLNPFTFIQEEVTVVSVPLEEFSVLDLFESSLGLGTARLLFANLESLYYNVWHFLPGLILLLMTCHHGFIALISGAYSIGVPLDAFSVATNSKRQQQLNVIKLELSTAERKWNEMELECARVRLHRAERPHAGQTSRAISPSSFLSPASKITPTQRKFLLARIHELREQYMHVSREMQPTSRLVRIASSPYVRNTVWVALTLCALLLTWHIILRVAQREARLIFRGSIFRWFRSADDPLQMAEEDDSTMATFVRNVWWVLYSLKTLLGTMLSVLTGRGLGSKTAAVVSTASAAVASAPLMPHPPLFDSPFLSGLVEFFRLLASVLLGVNGFAHPLVAFFVDVSCIGFFLFASAHKIYTSSFLAQFSPLNLHTLEEDRRSNTMLLFTPQFFTVNVIIFLLLASSLPFATWMLGLSSFDLLEFYPHSSVQFATGGSGGTVPVFVHLYNLTFLALTCWHATQISKRLVLYVIFDQIVARIELMVERCRIALGWSSKHAKLEQRFRLFGRCRRRTTGVAGPPLTRVQSIVYVVTRLFFVVRWLLSPFARGAWFLIRRASWVVLVVATFVWTHVHAFLRDELEDDDEEVSSSPPPVQSPTPKEDDELLVPTIARSESSMTTLLLAQVDAATQVATSDECASPETADNAQPGDVLGRLRSPSHRRGAHAAFFARSISAPIRFQTGDTGHADEDDVSSEQSFANDDSLASDDSGVDPLMGQVPTTYSPLYRSTTAFSARTERRGRGDSYFMTPGLVPSLSRKLTTDASSAWHELTDTGDRVVTEEDFPIFASPIATIDEEKEYGSSTSSAAGTPQYSPERSSHLPPLFELDELLDLSFESDTARPISATSTEVSFSSLRHPLPSIDDSLEYAASEDVAEESGASDSSDPSIGSLPSSPLLHLPPAPASPLLSPKLTRHRSQRLASISQSTSSDSEREE